MLKLFIEHAHALSQMLRDFASSGASLPPLTVLKVAERLDDLARAMTAADTVTAPPLLPGWICAACGAFNGEAKERRLACRHCDKPREETP